MPIKVSKLRSSNHSQAGNEGPIMATPGSSNGPLRTEIYRDRKTERIERRREK
jgi:hypothetical protein